MADTVAERYKAMVKERDRILAKTGSWKVERDKLVADIQPKEARIRELNGKIREEEQPTMADLEVQIRAMERDFPMDRLDPKAAEKGSE